MRKFFGIYLLTLFGLLINFSDQLIISCDPSIGVNKCGFYKSKKNQNMDPAWKPNNDDLIKLFDVNPSYTHILLFVYGSPDPAKKVSVVKRVVSRMFGKNLADEIGCDKVENGLFEEDEKNEAIAFPAPGSINSEANAKIKERIDAENKKGGDQLGPLIINLYYCGSGKVYSLTEMYKNFVGAEVQVFTQAIEYETIKDFYVAIPYYYQFKSSNDHVIAFPEKGGLFEIFGVVCVGNSQSYIFKDKEMVEEKMTGKLASATSTTFVKSFSWFKSMSCGKGIRGDGYFLKYDVPLPARKADYIFYAVVDGNPKEWTYDGEGDKAIPLRDVTNYRILI